MKNTTILAVTNYLANIPEMREYYEDMVNDAQRILQIKFRTEQSYATVKQVVLKVLATYDAPHSATYIYDDCKRMPDFPTDFTCNQLVYALAHYWDDVITKIPRKTLRKPYLYILKKA